MVPVINLKNEPKLREAFQYAHVHNNTVLIDRRTKWGNKFRIGADGTRDEVIALEELAELDGMWLACHCYPENRCHGEVLARAAAWAADALAGRDTRPAAEGAS